MWLKLGAHQVPGLGISALCNADTLSEQDFPSSSPLSFTLKGLCVNPFINSFFGLNGEQHNNSIKKNI